MTELVKSILAVFLGASIMLQAFCANAANRIQKPCVEKPVIEKPIFETRPKEPRQRQDSGMEKPLFEKPQFQKKEMARPMFEKPVIEKPAFHRECIESASLKKPDASAEKAFVPLPTVRLEKWGPIKSENDRLRFRRPFHQLERRGPPGFR